MAETSVTALVISMPGETTRRGRQMAQLTGLDIPCMFFDAITPAAISPEKLADLQTRWCRPLRPSEVACALSHRAVWDIVAKGTAPVLVLEDDAILAASTPAVLAALTPQALEYVNLETFRHPKHLGQPAPIAAGYTLAPIYRDSAGAAAYLLWPAGARKLLDGFSHILPLADAAINLNLTLRRHQVEPACAIQSMFLEEATPGLHSTVSAGKRPPVGGPVRWLVYKARRLWVTLRIIRMQRNAPRSATRRMVSFQP